MPCNVSMNAYVINALLLMPANAVNALLLMPQNEDS